MNFLDWITKADSSSAVITASTLLAKQSSAGIASYRIFAVASGAETPEATYTVE
jgi:hypothetical protein